MISLGSRPPPNGGSEEGHLDAIVEAVRTLDSRNGTPFLVHQRLKGEIDMAERGAPRRIRKTPGAARDGELLDQKGEGILDVAAKELEGFGISPDELSTLRNSVRRLAQRQVGRGSPCSAQVGVSTSEGVGESHHIWFHVTWTGLHPDRHAELMADLAQEFDRVVDPLHETHITPHIQFVRWSSLRKRTLEERLTELAEDQGYKFCGVWSLPELILVAA